MAYPNNDIVSISIQLYINIVLLGGLTPMKTADFLKSIGFSLKPIAYTLYKTLKTILVL